MIIHKLLLRCNYNISSVVKTYPKILYPLRNFTDLQAPYTPRKIDHMEGDVKVRPNPVVIKLETPEFQSIFTPELNILLGIFRKYEFDLRIAGGAVRDILMKKRPTDIDFATAATPDQMKDMFVREGIRIINTKGEKHGTITARINDKENFEITTLRIDVATDGRHADVQYTTEWLLDANRRDLTINSMFLGFDGTVYDYFYGYDDLIKRRVAFVGNPDTRIKEDFLRILRYFRFYGRIADYPRAHEPKTLDIIRANVYGLERISGERMWSETKKILQGNFGGELMMDMLDCGIGKFLGLPPIANIREFQRIWISRPSFTDPIHPITLITGLLHTPHDGLRLHERLKFSAFERDLCIFLTQNREDTLDVNSLMTYQQMCLNTIGKTTDMKLYVLELLKYQHKPGLHEQLKTWGIPKFPLDGNILKRHGCPPGKIVGSVISRLKMIWAREEFTTTPENLLKHLPEVLNEVIAEGTHVKKKPKYGLPPIANIREFQRIWISRPSFTDPIHPITLITSLLHSPHDGLRLHERLKFSAFERDLCIFLTQNRDDTLDVNSLMTYQQMCLNTIGKTTDMKLYVLELLKYQHKPGLHEQLKTWGIPKFPLDGNTLKRHGCPPGKIVGSVISRLQMIWAHEQFATTPENLLKHLPEVLNQVIAEGTHVKKKQK